MKYLKCAKCGKKDKPTSPKNVGTAVTMRCPDCKPAGEKYAILCRNCCPTGHGTRWETELPD